MEVIFVAFSFCLASSLSGSRLVEVVGSSANSRNVFLISWVAAASWTAYAGEWHDLCQKASGITCVKRDGEAVGVLLSGCAGYLKLCHSRGVFGGCQGWRSTA